MTKDPLTGGSAAVEHSAAKAWWPEGNEVIYPEKFPSISLVVMLTSGYVVPFRLLGKFFSAQGTFGCE
jgi:hypothetical protein